MLLILTGVIAVAFHFPRQLVRNTLPHRIAVSGNKQQDPGVETSVAPTNISPPTPEQLLDHYNAGTSVYDTKVRFWGKVVDQDGKPVEGATIAAIVVTLRMVKYKDGYREFSILTAKSAADGTFLLEGADGFTLVIQHLGKDGYVLPSLYQEGTRFKGATYSYHYMPMGGEGHLFRPNPSAPVIFHLWKLNKPEPVAIADIGRGGPDIKVGGPLIPFLFSNFRITDIGTVEAPRWEVTVSGLEADDGVIKADSSDIFMFQAPESGYTHSITFRYGPEGTDSVKGEPGAPVRFYIRSKRGRWYSAEDCAFFSPEADGTVNPKIRTWTNPNGSRNLEHDAAHPLPRPSLDN